MIKIKRTDSTDTDFIALVKLLDIYLAEMDGDEHAFYDSINKSSELKYVVIAMENNIVAGCGALKEFSKDIFEIKRMYTLPQFRGKGVASAVLKELDKLAKELHCSKLILETGKKQVDAVKLYKKNNYKSIANYGQYAGQENSLCFEKELAP